MIRLLVPGAHAGEVSIDGERHHYLTRVLRLAAGDELEVFDGRGQRFAARLVEVTESSARLTLEHGVAERPSRAVVIVQGLPKAEKLELVLQKATELGAAAIAPVSCERSVVKVSGKEEAKLTRWRRIVEEAARQCRRSDVPEVMEVATLAERAAVLAKTHVVLVLDEEERAVPLSDAVRAAGERPLALVIGPEGGLSRAELERLISLGAKGVTLGSLILRTETAALAALAVIRHLDGALG
ncbi:MAG: 16S rRNA (uracil(1498)-N(3))-methyltransferase [Myxococcaceae bacterium]